ncbi:MAG: hypothetical protein K6B68_18190 [Eubacterium sp.]|nr:hypothetical protein [Eubacterium sp.]
MIGLNENVSKEMNKYLDGITIEEILIVLSKNKRTFHYHVKFTKDQLHQDIEVLDLSVRAYHCLKRAGYDNLDSLVNGIYTKDGETSKKQLRKIRNLGTNSADEILIKLMNYHFMNLPDNKKKAYMDKLLDINFVAAD